MIRIRSKDQYLAFNANNDDGSTVDTKEDATILRNKPGYFLINTYSSLFGEDTLKAEKVEEAYILATQNGYLMKVNDYGVPKLTDDKEKALLLSYKQYTILKNLLENQGFLVEKEQID